ncbi:MAG: DUF5058 family protein [Saccharofermentanales bacterium]
MEFSLNSGFLYLLAVLVIVFVLAQSVFFLVKATKEARRIGIGRDRIQRVMVSSAIFTVAPAVSILLGVLSLSKFLGLPIPWIRLSVLGAITYELTAAASAAASAGLSVAEKITDPKVFTAIVWVMTLGIIPGVILVPIFLKKIQTGIIKIKNKDDKWGTIFLSAIFLGMISAFLGMVFSKIRNGLTGWIPVFVLLFSALVMILSGLLIRKFKIKWLEDYALPFSILGGMGFAIFITNVIL